MATVTCICEKCGKRYFGSNEMYAPPTRNLFKSRRNIEVPSTWEDWLLHIANNCHECRLKTIPTKCLDDLDKLKSR